jgi:hypothetical protein
MQKVKYKCKGCGWAKELPVDWGDVKPRFCPTPTCEMSIKKSKGRKSFRNNPDMLVITYSEIPVKTAKVEESASGREGQQQTNSRRKHKVPTGESTNEEIGS